MRKNNNNVLKQIFSVKHIVFTSILIMALTIVCVLGMSKTEIFKEKNNEPIKANASASDASYFPDYFWNNTPRETQPDLNCYAYAICKAMEGSIYHNYDEIVDLQQSDLIYYVDVFKNRVGHAVARRN